jgi:hypothetical protein
VVRGAPAIGVTAALSMAVELQRKQASKQPLTSADDVAAFVEAALAHLVTSRPTAVNLADACNNLQAAVEAAAAAEDATAATVVAAVVAAAEAYHAQDLSINTAIGKHGAAALLKATGKSSGLRVRARRPYTAPQPPSSRLPVSSVHLRWCPSAPSQCAPVACVPHRCSKGGYASYNRSLVRFASTAIVAVGV